MKTKDLIEKSNPLQFHEAIALIAYVSESNPQDIITKLDDPIKEETVNKFEEAIRRHNQGTPLAYILGYKYFYNSKFEVNSHTLIPRPETEQLIDLALKKISSLSASTTKILEIGTGSGCITVSLNQEFKNRFPEKHIKITATDISQEALKIAQINAKTILKKEGKINFVRADIIPENISEKFDIIISNPPYISAIEYKNLDKSVKDHEPRLALLAGETGAEIYNKIIEKTQKNARKDTTYIFEASPKTIPLLKDYYNELFSIKEHKDIYNKLRFIELSPKLSH